MPMLLHNKPTQNTWISALETFLLKKQVGVRIQYPEMERQRKHYQGEGHSSQNRTVIS